MDSEDKKLGIENLSSTGFQPELVNLTEMKEVVATSIFIGDGMSGKTQILITLGKLLLEYLQKIYQISKTNNPSLEAESQEFSKSLRTWAEGYGFFLRYGKIKWNIMDVSLDAETVGLEDFEFIFPYVWKGQTYKIKLQGNDVGGQNIFDHFRAVLGKIVSPEDFLIVVFDKSRQLSCFNSINQIKSIIENRSDFPRIIYCVNKIDLEEHIQATTWREGVSKSILQEIESISYSHQGEYSIPSLVGKEEKSIRYKIENNRLTFPDLEAIIYNSIRSSDSKYKTQLMSEVNTKALSREIAAQISYSKKADNIGNQNDHLGELWSDFKDLLFQYRPLAIQYSMKSDLARKEEDSDIYGRIREKWLYFAVNLPIPEELVMLAIEKAGSAGDFLSEMEAVFDTNALMGSGILKIIDHITQEALIKIGESSIQKTKEPIRRQFRRF